MIYKKRLQVLKIIGVAVFNLICLFSIIYCIVMTVEKRQAVSGEADVKVIKEFEGPKNPQQASGPAVRQVPQAASAAPTSQQAAQPSQAPAPVLQKAAALAAAPNPPTPSGDTLLVDDFSGDEIKNRLGSRANVYVRAPSRVMVSKRDDVISGNKTKVLMIRYDKKNTGGPSGMGGWCGYYTLVKDDKTNKYLDGTTYNYITFWVKGEKGDENFKVGLADEHWDKIGDSLKSEDIGVYLPGGKITTQWQKAKVPINVFFLDAAVLSSITINFEADCFPEGAGSGIVFIDDIAIEK